MDGTYHVYLGEKTCGKIQIIRQGLYYRLFCRCRLPEKQVFRLRACYREREENLGVLIPMEDGFGIKTQIPVKRFSLDVVRFIVVPVHGMGKGIYAPIKPEEPFGYIERLKDAYLIKKDNVYGIWIKESGCLTK